MPAFLNPMVCQIIFETAYFCFRGATQSSQGRLHPYRVLPVDFTGVDKMIEENKISLDRAKELLEQIYTSNYIAKK
ncbi:MAG: hypothetical protein L6406_23490 [Desulfobacterales bacterium]|nr:hypothetical protein [Desulfobacterales bacterium]